jgi:hypothetical protein
MGCMQTIPSQDQLNRIENRLQHLTELLELLVGKIEQDDESIFYKRSDYSAYRILSLRTTALTALLEKG